MIYHTPSRKGIEFFKPFTVRLLINVPGTYYRVGDLIQVEEAPNGMRFLDADNNICRTGVKEGRDYEEIL